MPHTRKLGNAATIGHILPAVTCSVQATYLTGTLPSEHGIVGNGWYFRDLCEVKFWHQSDKLVQRPRIWETAKQRNPQFTCANLFWWNAMYSGADVTITPRPMYLADGRKIPDLWTHPQSVRSWQTMFSQFPLFKFWGPATSIDSTKWIADSAIEADAQFDPTLSLIYLPHLDYNLQRLGPDDPKIQIDLNELDGVIRELLEYFQNKPQTRVIVLSEYGIEPVSEPIHINRILRENKLLNIRTELDREYLDAGASDAFAVADHQIAHVYVNNAGKLAAVKALLASTPGIDQVLDRDAQQKAGINHPRSGELLVIAKPKAWFTYYYWMDDAKAPDFARTVDIHRKPGYDPVELFTHASKLEIGWKLIKRKLGLRSLLDVIPLDARLVKGSHGRPPATADTSPVFLSSQPQLLSGDQIGAVEVRDLILRHIDV